MSTSVGDEQRSVHLVGEGEPTLGIHRSHEVDVVQDQTQRDALQEGRHRSSIEVATHQPLEELVRRGAFREDLFFRLNVVSLLLPPLLLRLPLLLPRLLKPSPLKLLLLPKNKGAWAGSG